MKYNKRFFNILKVSCLILLIVIGSLLIRKSGISNLYELEKVIKGSGQIDPIIYIVLFSILPTFFIPVTNLAMASGYVFGRLNAGIYTFIGAFINSTLTYFIGRYFVYDLILKLGYENIWLSGFKVGLAAWTGLLNSVYLDKKKKQEEIKNEK